MRAGLPKVVRVSCALPNLFFRLPSGQRLSLGATTSNYFNMSFSYISGMLDKYVL